MIAIGTFTRSSSFRVGVILASLSIAAILFVVYTWKVSSGDSLLREAESALNADTLLLRTLHKHIPKSELQAKITEAFSSDPAPPLYAIITADTALLAGNVSRWPFETTPAQRKGTMPISPDGSDETQIDTLYQIVELSDGSLLFTGRNIDELNTAQWVAQTFGWFVVALLSIVCVLSFSVALYVVNRINRMSATADNIIRTGSLRERLEIDSNWDDLSQLAVMFNGMLDKIEASVDNIKSVTDAIAHDLRTPLSRLRGTLENIDDPSLRERATSEADTILNMFNSLLRISDIESKRQRQGFTEVSLHTIVADVIELYQPVMENQEMPLSTDIGDVTMTGDPNLLFQAVANAIDNAIKYAGMGKRIDVSLRQTSRRYILAISDNGPGIEGSEFRHLERRFYRASASRTSHGNGLGLSLVSAIVALHNGEVWFVDDPLCEGAGFGIVFSFPK
ncbi:ATP-binding protein [Alteromonas sp. H39]|uniref:HAMP domain-containing sensor histidine kinase n=1 Tax=Alteromonas sp. H39 TaxID=3389876 RepID=UPI0039DF5A10